jgi:hypothetical protein
VTRVYRAFLLGILATILAVPPIEAKGSSSKPKSTSTHPYKTKKAKAAKIPKPTPPPSHRTKASVPRDAKGRIARSESAKRDFMKTSGYPNGRLGYVVDHIRPLACEGSDSPSNMQWQTKAAAKAKDHVERRGC